MKTCKYIGLAGVALLVVSSLLVAKSAMAVEKARYTVLEREEDFEIRQYDPQIVTETFVKATLKGLAMRVFAGSMPIFPERTRKSSQFP